MDAAFFATVDPQTLLFTAAAADGPLRAATPLFLDNEYGRPTSTSSPRWPRPADLVSR